MDSKAEQQLSCDISIEKEGVFVYVSYVQVSCDCMSVCVLSSLMGATYRVQTNTVHGKLSSLALRVLTCGTVCLQGCCHQEEKKKKIAWLNWCYAVTFCTLLYTLAQRAVYDSCCDLFNLRKCVNDYLIRITTHAKKKLIVCSTKQCSKDQTSWSIIKEGKKKTEMTNSKTLCQRPSDERKYCFYKHRIHRNPFQPGPTSGSQAVQRALTWNISFVSKAYNIISEMLNSNLKARPFRKGRREQL